MKKTFISIILILLSINSFAKDIKISKLTGIAVDIIENNCALRGDIAIHGTLLETLENETALAFVAAIPYAGNKFFMLSARDTIKVGKTLFGSDGDDKLYIESYDGHVLIGRFTFKDALPSYTCDSKIKLMIQ